MVGVGRSKVTQVVARPGVAGVTGQDAPLGLDLAQNAGRVVQSHMQSNRGVEAGEVNLTEVADGTTQARLFPWSRNHPTPGSGTLSGDLGLSVVGDMGCRSST